MASSKAQPTPAQDFQAAGSPAVGVEATIDYLVPGSRINRRYVAPGAELNTGRYAPHTVLIRNGRPVQGALGLDSHGFALKTAVDAVYSAEVDRIVKALTGADLVAPLGYVLRTSARRVPTLNPPPAKCTSI